MPTANASMRVAQAYSDLITFESNLDTLLHLF